jgi:ribosomal protein S18 acetylase RimI-like enzyme
MGHVMRQPASVVLVSGARYLQLATALLQRMRLGSLTGGIWEAADVQWWSRQERPSDEHGQLFWLDGQGEPVAAVIITAFRSIQCDALALPGDSGFGRAVWQEALRRVAALGLAAEFPVRSDDVAGLAELAEAGYRPAGEPGVVATWLAAARRPQVPALAPGYRLVSRDGDADRTHPLAARNGPEAEARLRQCSLYRPELDLAVEAPDGQVAGYGLFWADPVTRVGLVEPMRTEDAHQRRGIASHLLAAGLERLAAGGCERLKVSNDISLYLRAGFEPLRTATLLTYARPARS